MSEFTVTIDTLPPQCSVEFTFCGPIHCVNARNIDTDVAGPLVPVQEGQRLLWADLDPDGTVAP